MRRRTVSKLRNYSTQKRAEIYARALRRRFSRAEFEVRRSPFFTYAFRYLILCIRSADGRVIAGAWVSTSEANTMARSDTASEFGKRWDRRIPRGDIKWLVSRYHVTASSAEIETDIRRRCAQPDFSERLIRQSIAYALACHEHNRAVFRRVVTGQLGRDHAH